MNSPSILWFRHGLRVHDNLALLEAVNKGGKLMPIFIFDGESAGTKVVGYNRMNFLIDSLIDLNEKFKKVDGQLYIFKGDPVTIFRRIWEECSINCICYEQDCEPIWKYRDSLVENFCKESKIDCVEKIGHTLWDPQLVIKTNNGIPPLTYQMFLHTVDVIEPPPRPAEDPKWDNVEFFKLPKSLQNELNLFQQYPTPEDFGIYPEVPRNYIRTMWKGGETQAFLCFKERLETEEAAFKSGLYQPNQANPDILGSSKSVSPYLRFGCLSVRLFYWTVKDISEKIQKDYDYIFYGGPHVTGQLIWREYFYTMSVNNPFYGEMERNDICLNIPWSIPSEDQLNKWKLGQTGYPLIDAAMRQLLEEGWIHHILRNAVATFLTRGGLWFSWELGLQHFLKFLLDADWSVCAGNWMWISSSAFETLLDTSRCTCPIALATRLDPKGEYVRKYIPELKNVPNEFIFEPRQMPMEIQEKIGCSIGIHYPKRIIDLSFATKRNTDAMKALTHVILEKYSGKEPPHCRPYNEDEIRTFFWLSS